MSHGPVLVVVEIRQVFDSDRMRSYQEGARAQIAKFGGEVVARGGDPVEGAPPFGILMIQKWPSAEAFKKWQSSDEYRPLMERRRKAADLRIATVPIVTKVAP
jgi:uncharacterized protein (DUF1330 family)